MKARKASLDYWDITGTLLAVVLVLGCAIFVVPLGCVMGWF